MDASSQRRQWIWIAVLLGAAYLAAGIVFGELSGTATSDGMRLVWRRAAWLVSLVAFAGHIAYEHVRLRNVPRISAFHASVGVALGSFGLAVLANIHAQPTTRQRVLMLLALVLWPTFTAIPAFLVALAASAGLSRATRTN